MRFANFEIDDIELGFTTCVDRLEASLGDVPPGWHRIFLDGVQSLRAVEDAERTSVEIGTPQVLRTKLLIEQLPTAHSRPDHVVRGILRKLAAKSACTCQLCGRAGWVRTGGVHMGTYCAHCWVPRQLRWELRMWLDRMSEEQKFRSAHPVVLWDALGTCLKAVMPDDALHTLAVENRRLLCITADRFLQLRSQLRLLKDELDHHVSSLDESEYRWRH